MDIYSRKLNLNSLGRHFSSWKYRNFRIDEANLMITTESSGMVVTCPIQQISVKHHYYASKDQPFNLSLMCRNAIQENKHNPSNHSNDSNLEIVLKFDNMESMSKFESVMKPVHTEMYILNCTSCL